MAAWFAAIWAEVPLIAMAAGLPVVVMAFVASKLDVPAKQVLLPLIAVSLLGAIAGLAGGVSRTGVVGDIVPAALALIGTVSIYVFGAKPDNGPVVGAAAAAFALALGLGYAAGAGKRGPLDAVAQNYAFCEELFKAPDLYEDDGGLARASNLFGEYCANAFGFAHAKTTAAEDDAAAIAHFRERFENAGGSGSNSN